MFYKKKCCLVNLTYDTTGVDITVDHSFKSFKSEGSCSFPTKTKTWKTLCFPKTIGVGNVAFWNYQNPIKAGVDIPVGRSFQSYQNSDKFKS